MTWTAWTAICVHRDGSVDVGCVLADEHHDAVFTYTSPVGFGAAAADEHLASWLRTTYPSHPKYIDVGGTYRDLLFIDTNMPRTADRFAACIHVGTARLLIQQTGVELHPDPGTGPLATALNHLDEWRHYTRAIRRARDAVVAALGTPLR